jgi:putative ABC transport system permease protein
VAFLRLVRRNLLRHPLRSLLTIGSIAVALFLVCVLRSLVTTMQEGLAAANPNRMVVQSAISLFAGLPLNYQAKIDGVPGVETTSKWQWFGAYYQQEQNQFSQFAVDPDTLFELFGGEMELVQGSREAWSGNRQGCIVGEGLAAQFGFGVGDRVPLIGLLHPHPDGPDTPWEFEVEAIYRPTVRNFSSHGMFFHWDYFEKTLESGGRPVRVGTIYLAVTPGADRTQVMATIDGMFENGPQRVQTTPESEFQAQFVSMFGNIPFFVSAIGAGILAAILLASVNTMLMAARDQTHDIGVLKALGFGDGWTAALLFTQALFLCLVGGLLGVGFALLVQDGIAAGMGAFFPGFANQPSTVVLGLGIALGVGLVSGIVPAWRASRMRCIEALGATE